MPFLRFTRDKRGYEQFALVESLHRRGKPVSRVLYWYRTPPDVKVGREPFDAAVRQALEAQYPGVRFDWRQILETPIPSADAEKWRERRRVERIERAARRASPDEDEAEAAAESSGEDAPKHVIEAAAAAAVDTVTIAEQTVSPSDQPVESAATEPISAPRQEPSSVSSSRRKRRRRRGGRGRPPIAPGAVDAAPVVSAGEEPASDKDE